MFPESKVTEIYCMANDFARNLHYQRSAASSSQDCMANDFARNLHCNRKIYD